MPLGLANKPLVDTERGPAIADELVVSIDPAAAAEADLLAREVGAEIVWRVSFADAFVLRFADAADVEAAAVLLARDRRVQDVAPIAIARGSGEGADALRSLQWNLPGIGLGRDGAPDVGQGVRVAILDSGVAYENHSGEHGDYALAPSLEGVPFVAPFDFVDLDEHANDALGHGTHVASLIAAQQGLAPVAGGVEIMPVRILDETGLGTDVALAEGIVYATDQGADVINLSLAFPLAYFPSHVLLEAVDYASERDVVMVAASGNHGANVVAYPAAFREVLSAGASALARGQSPEHAKPWPRLERAPYSNQGFLVDVLAPGGRIDRDVVGDGHPDGIIAEAFAGDPLDIEPMLFAGTSQAAAHVTGVVTAMLAENPDLRPHEVRAILGDTASGVRRHLSAGLDWERARGYVRADDAVAAAAELRDEPPRYFAGVHVTIEEPGRSGFDGGSDPLRFARAVVEVVDEHGAPVPRALVHGSFTGSGFGSHTARTDRDGIAHFQSRQLRGAGLVVAFQAEAVADARRGVVDRPLGLLRTDSCSLELIAEFAENAGGEGDASRPAGIGTSPLAVDAPGSSRHATETLSLLNFSWSMGTAPMAVAAEAAWFREQFEDAGDHTIPSEGAGIGTSPLRVEGVSGGGESDVCVDLLVSTFATGSQGIGTSPLGSEPSPSGIGTSPLLVPIAPDPSGNCGSHCDTYRDVIAELWISTRTDSDHPAWSDDLGIPESHYDHIADMVNAYAEFGTAGTSSPVAAYVSVLSAAGLGLSTDTGHDANGRGMSFVSDSHRR